MPWEVRLVNRFPFLRNNVRRKALCFRKSLFFLSSAVGCEELLLHFSPLPGAFWFPAELPISVSLLQLTMHFPLVGLGFAGAQKWALWCCKVPASRWPAWLSRREVVLRGQVALQVRTFSRWLVDLLATDGAGWFHPAYGTGQDA